MYRRSHAVGSCARPSPGSARAQRSLRRSRACTSSRRRSRSIAPFRRAASARGWCLHWSLRSCLRPVDSRRCRLEAAVPAIAKEYSDPSRRRCGTKSARGRRDQARGEGAAPTTPPLRVGSRAAMAAASAVQGETIGLFVVAVVALVGTWMRLVVLPAGDEGRQAVDVAIGRRVALRLARLVGLALLVLRERLRVARDIGLRLAGGVRRGGGGAHRRAAHCVARVEGPLTRARRVTLPA